MSKPFCVEIVSKFGYFLLKIRLSIQLVSLSTWFLHINQQPLEGKAS